MIQEDYHEKYVAYVPRGLWRNDQHAHGHEHTRNGNIIFVDMWTTCTWHPRIRSRAGYKRTLWDGGWTATSLTAAPTLPQRSCPHKSWRRTRVFPYYPLYAQPRAGKLVLNPTNMAAMLDYYASDTHNSNITLPQRSCLRKSWQMPRASLCPRPRSRLRAKTLASSPTTGWVKQEVDGQQTEQ